MSPEAGPAAVFIMASASLPAMIKVCEAEPPATLEVVIGAFPFLDPRRVNSTRPHQQLHHNAMVGRITLSTVHNANIHRRRRVQAEMARRSDAGDLRGAASLTPRPSQRESPPPPRRVRKGSEPHKRSPRTRMSCPVYLWKSQRRTAGESARHIPSQTISPTSIHGRAKHLCN